MRRAWFVVVGRPCFGMIVNQQATSHQQSTTRGLFAPGSAARVVVELSAPGAWAPSRPGGGVGGQLPALRGLPPGGGQRSCRPATRRLLASLLSCTWPSGEGRAFDPCPVHVIPRARVHRAKGNLFLMRDCLTVHCNHIITTEGYTIGHKAYLAAIKPLKIE